MRFRTGLWLWLVLVGAGRAQAHDPFEITTDAHIDEGELRLHTTLSLVTAGRLCLPQARGRLVSAELEAVRPALQSCARDFYRLTAAGAPLTARAVALSLTAEEDLDLQVSYPRPEKGPLVFDAVALRRVTHPSAGVVLTVTGVRAFLGQQVLRPESPTLEVSLAPDTVATRQNRLLLLLGLLVAGYGARALVGVVLRRRRGTRG